MDIVNDATVKTERVLKALNHEEPDRVPVGEFFWTLFVERWLKEKNLPPDTSIYDYYDLDILYISPDMSPRIQRRQVIEQTDEYMIFRSAFGSTIKKEYAAPMPYFLDFPIKSADEYKDFVLEDPLDDRRYYDLRDDIVNAGDSLVVLPSFYDAVSSEKARFMICGGVCEPFEYLWRCRGTESALMDLVLYPEQTQAFIDRITDFMILFAEKQIKMFDLKGIYMWGDVAYDKGMFFSPAIWEKMFYPSVKRLCSTIHSLGAKVIYHGCGNSTAVMDMMIDAGIDAYNPLEAKAGLDVVALKRKYGKRLAFNGNIDVRVLAQPDKSLIKKEVLHKLNAAKGGGYIIQSDHSIPMNVPAENYDYMIQLVRDYGNYPLDLGEYDEEI